MQKKDVKVGEEYEVGRYVRARGVILATKPGVEGIHVKVIDGFDRHKGRFSTG